MLLELAPGPTLMSRDNFDSMAIDNVASGPIAPELGLTPTPLAAIAPAYLRRGPARFGREDAVVMKRSITPDRRSSGASTAT